MVREFFGLDLQRKAVASPPATASNHAPAHQFLGDLKNFRDVMFSSLKDVSSAPNTDNARIDAIEQSVVAFACVRRIAWSAASVDFTAAIDRQGTMSADSPIAQLLSNPNPQGGWHTWQLVYASLAINGRAYLLRVGTSFKLNSIHYLHSEFITKKTNDEGQVTAWEYRVGGRLYVYEPQDVLEIIHPSLAQRIPYQSQVYPAWSGMALFNGASGLMRKVLENSGGLPGILSFDPADDVMTGEQEQALRDYINAFRAGGDNFGKIGMMNRKATFVRITEDVDRIAPLEIKADAVEDICAVFGVPSLLIIGNSTNATFANQKEARRYFWLDTVQTGYLKPVASALSGWLGVKIGHDLSEVAAISDWRLDLINVLANAPLTVNEKREQLGYEPIADPSANVLFIPMGQIPIGNAVAEANINTQQRRVDLQFQGLAQ
ncbi:MAG: phage portal protein [Beijerinckiaceae bacterium]